MPDRPERDLRKNPIFSKLDVGIWENRHNLPWPKTGERLLDNPAGEEGYVFPYKEWFPNDFERLGFFAHLFQERARDLVRLWVHSSDKPENFVYAVGFMYRHAIELYLKDIIARHASFANADSKAQAEAIKGHNLISLWGKVKPIISDFTEAHEIRNFEAQLAELHQLDEGSDGFRYPFGFSGRFGNRKPLLDGVAYVSFDNLVWILDGLCNWLATSEDMEEQHLHHGTGDS